jgi:hypothetical protein
MENVADWSAALRTTELTRLEQHLRCLSCDGPVEKALAALGSLRCLACREVNAPLDARLFAEFHTSDTDS